MRGLCSLPNAADAALQLRRQSGMWASSSTATHQPSYRPASRPSRSAQPEVAHRLRAVASPSAERDAAAAVPAPECEPVVADWQQLEALYHSDPQSASPVWQLPLMDGFTGLDAILRPELLRMAVMEKNESPASVKEAEDERRRLQDYYANVGDAIRTLREEVPRLFIQDLTYDIYRDDVVFKDPRNTVSGKKNYKRIFRGVRLLGRLAFTRCRVDVTRIWQPEHNQISLRWQFHGVPRIPWEVQGVFDGVSIFKLDRCVFVWQGSRFGSAGSDPCCLVPLCAAFVQMSDQAFEATRLIMKSWEGSSG
mmetsp:Transcript_16258/g.48702  ORF Transcript_16258/g.48702 Transcript_16258/m.48702 type:complete len:308 (+) Transcript_16258:145-1068(+)